jgi:hypothetical protein
MLATPLPSYATWLEALTDIGLAPEHVTEDLISTLCANEFSPSTLNEESFTGYYKGYSEYEAGAVVAREFTCATIEAFLESAINWNKAWENLRDHEGYILIKVGINNWALFADQR